MRSCTGTLQAAEAYALRSDAAPGILDRTSDCLALPLRLFESSWLRLSRILPAIHGHADAFGAMSDAGLRRHCTGLRQRLKKTRLALPAVAEAFALIREISSRRLGMTHFDVQLVGGWAMLNGMVAEMATGEGKTLTATLAAGTAALSGIPVHVITVNDYLAGRDAEAMRPVYEAIGLSVGASLSGMSDAERRLAYRCDVTYSTNTQVAFDHLRDRIRLRHRNSQLGLRFDDREALLLRGLHFALVDEADSVLVDEAVTPLIISRQGKPIYTETMLRTALETARTLQPGVHFSLRPQRRQLELLPEGQTYLEQWSKSESGLWRNTRYREHLVQQALRALYFYERDRQYLLDDGKVRIIDEFTGRLMPDRSWEQGLHQLIETKEGCEITGEMETIGRISYQRFFRRYRMLGGMSGTVREVASELRSVYQLSTVSIPPNRRNRRRRLPPVTCVTESDKWQTILQRIRAVHECGRPVLIGTRSVAASERLSQLLSEAQLPHRILNARQDREEAEIIGLAGQPGQITVATNMAGRGTDIRLGAGVADLGGLHVIATERHEARRIDRQLWGRCARQGDPGSCEEVLSLEDELLQHQLPPWALRLARVTGLSTGTAAILLMGFAQRRAQRRSHRMRLRMQKMDEYLENVLAFTGKLE
ncbi:MAG: prepilin peptidase [Oceanospirillaceae bacterium]|nr:prepilin peptidase [Oceanospirillaceae bacterium]